MKKYLLVFICIFLVSVGCKKSEKATGAVYEVDTSASKIEWRGSKVQKGSTAAHFGTMGVKNGTISVSGSQITGGTFSAGLAGISSGDLAKSTEGDRLVSTMKGVDFFDSERFPDIKFDITDVVAKPSGDYNSVISGNLVVKGIRRPVKFLANIFTGSGEISIATEPTDLSLHDFGIGYRLPAADGVLEDLMNVQVFIKARERK